MCIFAMINKTYTNMKRDEVNIQDYMDAIDRGFHRRRDYDEFRDVPTYDDYDRYTSTGEEYEIDSDGCEYWP